MFFLASSVFDNMSSNFGIDVSDIYKVAGLIVAALAAIWGVGRVMLLMKGKGDGGWSYAPGLGAVHFDGTGKADKLWSDRDDDGKWVNVKGKGLFHFDNKGTVDYQQGKDGYIYIDTMYGSASYRKLGFANSYVAELPSCGKSGRKSGFEDFYGHVSEGAKKLGSTKHAVYYERNGEIFKTPVGEVSRKSFSWDVSERPSWSREPGKYEFGWESLEVQNRGYYFVR